MINLKSTSEATYECLVIAWKMLYITYNTNILIMKDITGRRIGEVKKMNDRMVPIHFHKKLKKCFYGILDNEKLGWHLWFGHLNINDLNSLQKAKTVHELRAMEQIRQCLGGVHLKMVAFNRDREEDP